MTEQQQWLPEEAEIYEPVSVEVIPFTGPAFDYTQLPEEVASDAQKLVVDLRGFERRAVEQAAEIGRRLISIRDRLDHGLFLRWVEAEFGSKSTAYRCMDVARRLADELPTVGSLPLNVVYKLAAPTTPEPVRTEIVTRLKAGERIAPRQIEDTVKDARKQAKAEAEARLSPEQRKRRDRAAKRHEAEFQREKQEREAKQEERKAAAAQAMQMLSDRFNGDELRALVELLQRSDLHRMLEILNENETTIAFDHRDRREVRWK